MAAGEITFGAQRDLIDQWMWLLIAIGAAVILAAVVLITRKEERTKGDYGLLTLGPTLVVLGIIFGDDRLIGYSFIGAGVLLSIISAIKSSSNRMNRTPTIMRYCHRCGKQIRPNSIYCHECGERL
jgi:uncharacterized membrane protein